MWSVDTRVENYRITAHLSVTETISCYSAERLGACGFRRPVTLAALHAQLAGAAKFSNQFVDAALLFARLPEDRFLTVEDLGSFDGRIYCVTPTHTGWNLSRFLEIAALAGEALTLPACYFLAFAVADALALVEQVGCATEVQRSFHGDVSPTTVLVGSDGRVRLTMPSVRLRDEPAPAKHPNALVTRSPEQRRGERGDARADVFALGVLLWGLTNRVARGDVALDGGVRELVMRALSVERRARPMSAAAFRDALCGRVPAEIAAGDAQVRAAARQLASRGVLRVTTCDVRNELEPTTAFFCRRKASMNEAGASPPEERSSPAVQRVADGVYVLPPNRVALQKLPRVSIEPSDVGARQDKDADEPRLGHRGAALCVVGTNDCLLLSSAGDRWVIGRGSGVDLVLTDRDVSREHCELVRERDGGYAVYDLGSKNGVYVNGVRVDDQVLSGGDEVRVGNTRLLLRI